MKSLHRLVLNERLSFARLLLLVATISFCDVLLASSDYHLKSQQIHELVERSCNENAFRTQISKPPPNSTNIVSMISEDRRLAGGMAIVRRGYRNNPTTYTQLFDGQDESMVFMVGGGPGLSGLTMKRLLGPQLELEDWFDIGFVLPPGSVTHPDGVSLREAYRNKHETYDAVIKFHHKMIKQSLRTPTQKVILTGHSFGGIQVADIAIYNQSLPPNERFQLTDLVFIASPLSSYSYNTFLEENRKKHAPEIWNNKFLAFLNRPDDQSYRDLVASYESLVFPEAMAGSVRRMSDENWRKVIYEIVYQNPVSPLSLTYVRRKWEADSDPMSLIAKIRALPPHIKKIGFYGTKDLLLPSSEGMKAHRDAGNFLDSDYMGLDVIYKEAGIKPVKVEGGSHFCFADRGNKDLFLREFGDIKLRNIP